MSVGDIERQLRDAARQSGLSMKALSDRAGVPYAAVHGFVTGASGITLRTASKLARLLRLELRSVRRRKPDKPGGQQRKVQR